MNAKTQLKILTLLTAVLCHPALAKTLTIGLDLSGSNPLLTNMHFNQEAVNFLTKEVGKLSEGDHVLLKTFGSTTDTINFLSYEMTIERGTQQKVAGNITNVITELPNKVKPQGSTNIISWLTDNDFDCSDGSHLVVLTDAIEASEYIDPHALIAGEAQLPAPNEFIELQECKVTYFGLGVGRAASEKLALRRAWRAFFAETGASFKEVVK